MLGAARDVIALPASAINYAPYGDSVFVVADMKDPKGQTYRGVRQQFVKLGRRARRPDRGPVGRQAGDEIVTSGVFKLRNGARRPGQQQACSRATTRRRSRRTAE